MKKQTTPADPIALGRFEFGIVRRKVRQLIGHHGFNAQDSEQLEQELIARLLQGLPSFDPSQSHRNAFVTTIVERSVATIIRNKRAEKRDDRHVGSLNAIVCNDDGTRVEIGATLDQQTLDAQRGRYTRTAEEHSDLNADVAECMAALPDDLRLLAEQLKHKTVSQIAREMGIPRTTLRERVVELRRRFEAAGMRLHL